MNKFANINLVEYQKTLSDIKQPAGPEYDFASPGNAGPEYAMASQSPAGPKYDFASPGNAGPVYAVARTGNDKNAADHRNLMAQYAKNAADKAAKQKAINNAGNKF